MKPEIQEKAERICGLLPQSPRPADIDTLVANGRFADDILIFRAGWQTDLLCGKRERAVHVKCTACGGETTLDYGIPDANRYPKFGFYLPDKIEVFSDGDECRCPMCKKLVKAVHIGKYRYTYCLGYREFLTVENIEGCLCLLLWYAERQTDKSGNVSFLCGRVGGMMVVEGTPVYLSGRINFYGSYRWLDKWEWRKTFKDAVERISPDLVIPFDASVTDTSNCRNCALKEYINSVPSSEKCQPVRYIEQWLKHRNIENLVTSGHGRYLNEILDTCLEHNYSSYYEVYNIFRQNWFREYVDFRKVRPHEMLRLTKEQMEYTEKFRPKTVALYIRMLNERGIKLTDEALAIFEGLNDDLNRKYMTELLFGGTRGYLPPAEKTLNYYHKQSKTNDYVYGVSYLRDYWNMIFEVYGEAQPALMFPKDLHRAHDDIQAKIKYKQNQQYDEQIRKTLVKRNKWRFADERLGLLIRPAASSMELIDEGKILSHCVGGYVQMHAEFKITILFIRHIDDPDKPFYTLEWDGKKVVQNRGNRNCARTPEVIEFENEWVNFMMKGQNKDGRITEHTESVRAGA